MVNPITYDEAAIAKSAFGSYSYAIDVLNGRFEAGEAAIAKNPHIACHYAKNVLNGRFELGEAAIAENDDSSYLYAKDVLNGRFQLGEKAIKKYALTSYLYALICLKERFEAGEPAIKNSAYSDRYNYAFGISKVVPKNQDMLPHVIRWLKTGKRHDEDLYEKLHYNIVSKTIYLQHLQVIDSNIWILLQI